MPAGAKCIAAAHGVRRVLATFVVVGAASLHWRTSLSHLPEKHSLHHAFTLDTPTATFPTQPNSLSQLGEVAVLAVDGTQLVAEAARRHGTAPTATAALGRTLLGALLMGSFRKDDEAIQLSFKGDGMLGGVFAIADTKVSCVVIAMVKEWMDGVCKLD